MTTLQSRLQNDEVLILDGAMGTELQRRGVPMHSIAWSAAALLTHPEVVRHVHEEYIRAGADVIITNSFSTARHALEAAGMGYRTVEMNRRAVELAKEARERVAAEREVLIAGSLSTFLAVNENLGPKLTATLEQIRDNFREQAELLAEAGVDLMILEMIQDTEIGMLALEGAFSIGLPVWLGLSCVRTEDGEGLRLLGDEQGHTFGQDIQIFLSKGPSLVSIMHTEVGATAPALEIVRGSWKGPMGAYPHSGAFVMPNWQFEEVISPEDFLANAQEWVRRGVQVIGACCGLGPEYIQLLRDRLPARVPNP